MSTKIGTLVDNLGLFTALPSLKIAVQEPTLIHAIWKLLKYYDSKCIGDNKNRQNNSNFINYAGLPSSEVWQISQTNQSNILAKIRVVCCSRPVCKDEMAENDDVKS
mgnify:CR=1 FL=1